MEYRENLKYGVSTNSYFTLGNEEEIDTNTNFKDSNEIAKLIDQKLDKYDDHPSPYCTGKLYRSLRKTKLNE